MSDIRTTWQADTLAADWLLTGGRLETDRDIETAVVISLMTDRLAADDDVLPDFSGDRRGWWGDLDARALYGVGEIGSRLWLLRRAKATDQTPALVESYIREALDWLLDLKVAAAIEVETFWIDRVNASLGAVVTVIRGPQPNVALRFEPLWDAFEG